jgi:hypothetical protein
MTDLNFFHQLLSVREPQTLSDIDKPSIPKR